MSLYPHPLVPGYGREALRSFRSLRSVVFSAVMIAACIVLSRFYIPLHESLTLSVTFLARALCALVCGPLVAMVFAVAEDTLSFFLSSGGYPYFPGYALTTLLGCLTYALFFYRARITWRRIILAKTLTNIQNVFLGSLWSAMLYSKGYLYYMTTSAVKNLIYLPIQILMLALVLRCVLPALRRQGLVPQQLTDGRITF
ncbi:folate family ECF transporter S component [Dysosmobacter sp.]|uniref:folate family ECF transporter S component n=1 Tax=Dysosmobacter sp. TaxID=2591382 RepID=UPI003AB71514